MPFDPKADDGGWFSDTMKKLGIDPKDARVKTAESMYQKAIKGAGEKGNAALIKAALEKDPKKKHLAEQAVMKMHQEGLKKIRQETAKVLDGFKKK